MPIQPFILVVGTPLQPKEIVVYFDTIKYKVFTMLRAIDVCFKIIHLFNLEYPVESCAVWAIFTNNLWQMLIISVFFTLFECGLY